MSNGKTENTYAGCYSDLDSTEVRMVDGEEIVTHEIVFTAEHLTEEDIVRNRISELIRSGSVLDLAELYDLILNNLFLASKEEIRVLLTAMPRPRESDNAEIIRTLTMHRDFDNAINGNIDKPTKLYSKGVIIGWVAGLATISEDSDSYARLSAREKELRAEYIEARDSFVRSSDESERYKELYDKIKKLTPNSTGTGGRGRKLSTF